MEKIKGMATCCVCGRDFPLITEESYIARDKKQVGLAPILNSEEPILYDAFDCPHCGCQNIMQERKRIDLDFDLKNINFEDDIDNTKAEKEEK